LQNVADSEQSFFAKIRKLKDARKLFFSALLTEEAIAFYKSHGSTTGLNPVLLFFENCAPRSSQKIACPQLRA
jgi:hypothetical protein